MPLDRNTVRPAAGSGGGTSEEMTDKVDRDGAIRLIEIAEQTGIKDRGLIAKGKFADLVIFDPDTIERGAEEQVYDLPGQKPRFIRHPKGIDTVINIGKVVHRNGKYTDARPGMVV